MDYVYGTQPFAHQHDAFMRSRDATAFGFFMEQGTGKTKVCVDTAAYLFAACRIDALLVIAPKGVHANWTLNEIPTHMPPYVPVQSVAWENPMRAATRKALGALYDRRPGPVLRVLSMNVDAVNTDGGFAEAKKFLACFRTLLVIDEATVIANPKAERTKACMKLGKLAKYRRIATGTPTARGPFALFAQMRFLDESILGYSSFVAFKHHFADWQSEMNYRTRRAYDVLIGYKNLEELQALIAPHSFRVRKVDCLDLPEKLYSRVYVDMVPEQRKAYDDIKARSRTELASLEQVSAQNVLEKYLRLQQITGGAVLNDNGTLTTFSPNHRIRAVLDSVEECEGKVIVWARYRHEVRAIAAALVDAHGPDAVVTYHGDNDAQERARALQRFQGDADGAHDPACRFIVANVAAGGYGLTLTRATTVVYYSNTFSLEQRLQSEDRAHRIGQKHPVLYIDIECKDTVDSRIIAALRSKRELSDLVMQDKNGEWL